MRVKQERSKSNAYLEQMCREQLAHDTARVIVDGEDDDDNTE